MKFVGDRHLFNGGDAPFNLYIIEGLSYKCDKVYFMTPKHSTPSGFYLISFLLPRISTVAIQINPLGEFAGYLNLRSGKPTTTLNQADAFG
jgi:hypothetical protein